MEALAEIDPREAQRLLDRTNEWAMDAFLRRSCSHQVELSREQFCEFLVLTGRNPCPEDRDT